MKTRHSTLFLLIAIMIISVSIGTVSASFAYYEGDVQSAVGYGYFDIGDFVYNTGAGSFSSVDELRATLLDANKSEEVSNKYFGSTMKVSQDDEGNINLSSTSKTSSVLFTPEFIYELQQLGVKTINVGKITTSASYNNSIISYTNYNGVGKYFQDVSNGWTLDISSTQIFPDGSGGYYYLDENGEQVAAQSVSLNTIGSNYSWTLDSVSFN
ncbi:MAG: hypothetical protein J6K44_04570 [Clostridia bacterium]|nr:hypothetical protein [Clostridia bacterium]